MANVILMPAVVADAEDAVLTSWLVAEGDTVKKGQPLAEIETDKANVEVEADAAGTVGRLLAEPSQRVAVGAPIAVLLAAGEDASAIDAALGESSTPLPPPDPEGGTANADESPEATEELRDTPAEQDVAATARPDGERIFASPLARRIAAENGLDIATISGRGPHGRILKADVTEAIEAAKSAPKAAPAAAAAPAAEAAPRRAEAGPAEKAPEADGAYEDIALTGMRRAIARRLTESKSSVPHFYITVDVRMDALLAFRKQLNEAASVKISVNDLLVKAIASALQAVPNANAVWNGDSIRRYDTVDISVAVSTDGGLITPVVRGVEKLGLVALANTTKDLIERPHGQARSRTRSKVARSRSATWVYGVREFSATSNAANWPRPPAAGAAPGWLPTTAKSAVHEGRYIANGRPSVIDGRWCRTAGTASVAWRSADAPVTREDAR